MTEKFWVVWNPKRGLPRVTHPTFEAAQIEAKRLASFNPDEDFHVLELVGTARKVQVVWETAREMKHEVPF